MADYDDEKTQILFRPPNMPASAPPQPVASEAAPQSAPPPDLDVTSREARAPAAPATPPPEPAAPAAAPPAAENESSGGFLVGVGVVVALLIIGYVLMR
ncbi:MAG: hypothetical protein ACPHTD_07950 [Gammaproteobacteria bacterium]|jgi:hypothetical protein